MTEEAKIDWLTAAWGTLNGIPSDLLTRGASVARRYCDHPSKIVPAILREVEETWQRRKSNLAEVLAAIAKMEQPPLEPEERCTPEQAREILAKLNLKLDGDEPQRSPDYIPVEQRSAPTAEDWKRWGITPDQSEAA